MSLLTHQTVSIHLNFKVDNIFMYYFFMIHKKIHTNTFVLVATYTHRLLMNLRTTLLRADEGVEKGRNLQNHNFIHECWVIFADISSSSYSLILLVGAFFFHIVPHFVWIHLLFNLNWFSFFFIFKCRFYLCSALTLVFI